MYVDSHLMHLICFLALVNCMNPHLGHFAHLGYNCIIIHFVYVIIGCHFSFTMFTFYHYTSIPSILIWQLLHLVTRSSCETTSDPQTMQFLCTILVNIFPSTIPFTQSLYFYIHFSFFFSLHEFS